MRRIARKLLKLNDLYPSQILLRRIGLLRRLAQQAQNYFDGIIANTCMMREGKA